MADEKIIVVNQSSGNTAGILAIVFAILGIFFLGILFVPLALICAIIATIKMVKGLASKLVTIIAWILLVIAIATSPSLLALFGAGAVVKQINTANHGAIGIAYSQEFETALKQIKEDFSMRGEFRDLRLMTTVRQFEDSAINEKIEIGKPIKFGVGVKSKDNMEFCAEMTLKQNGDKYIIETKNINEKKEICKEFHNMTLYQKLKTFSIN